MGGGGGSGEGGAGIAITEYAICQFSLFTLTAGTNSFKKTKR